MVTDNGTQLNNADFKKYCEDNAIDLRFTSVAHPQANGQAEVANRIILDGLKKKVEGSRNNWVDEVLPILWAYRTTCKVNTGATPFMLAYGAEAVVPVEISHTSPRVEDYTPESNVEGMRLALDMIDEVRDEAHAKVVEYQKRSNLYYNLRVEGKVLQRRRSSTTKDRSLGSWRERKASTQLGRSIQSQECLWPRILQVGNFGRNRSPKDLACSKSEDLLPLASKFLYSYVFIFKRPP